MKTLPHVALVAPSLDILGGQAVQAHTLLERLRSDGVRVDFVPINPRFPAALGWLRRVPYCRTVLNEALYIASLLRSLRGEVVHIFTASYWSFLLVAAPASILGRLLGKRVLVNYHSGEAADHLAHYGALVHPWLRAVDEIVVPSEYLRGVFAEHGYTARVIPNVVELEQFHYRERAALSPRLLSTRNLEAHYGVHTTIEAFGLLRRRYPDASLIIAGEGSERARLVELARQAGGNIQFVGRIERGDVPALYDSRDIFVNSSLIDNQPLSVLEALASGLPVVSTAPGDVGALVQHGETGTVVPPSQPRATAEAVAALLDDPARARRMARRGHDKVRRHCWSEVASAWLAAYQGQPA